MSIEAAGAIQGTSLEDLLEALNDMYMHITERNIKNRMRQISKQNKKANIIAPTFSVGYFVRQRRRKTRVTSGLITEWIMTKVIKELVYEIAKLDGTDHVYAHASAP